MSPPQIASVTGTVLSTHPHPGEQGEALTTGSVCGVPPPFEGFDATALPAPSRILGGMWILTLLILDRKYQEPRHDNLSLVLFCCRRKRGCRRAGPLAPVPEQKTLPSSLHRPALHLRQRRCERSELHPTLVVDRHSGD
eukprot:1348555-Rhodomonas_salina.3